MKWNKEKAKAAALYAEKKAHFGRACEQDVVRDSSNIECPEESFSIVDGFAITEKNVPDGIRKHASFRPGNQRGDEESDQMNCQRPRKRSRIKYILDV